MFTDCGTGPCNPPPRISVIIAHLNQPEMLATCLDSLMAGRRLPDEVLVVDNGSIEPPKAVCDSYSNVRFLVEHQPGPGPARSLGARHAKGAILVFTDADCQVDAGWLEDVERAMSDASNMILGGDVRIALVNPDQITMLEAYESVFSFRVQDYIRRDNYTVTCNLATRADVFRNVGDFAGLETAEDLDWGRRATALGYQIIYCPNMIVRHPARSDLSQMKVKWNRQTGHAFRDVGKNPKARLKWALRGLAMFISPLGEFPGIITSDKLCGIRARILAFAGLTAIRFHRGRIMLWLLSGGDPAKLVAQWNRPATPAGSGR